MSRVAVTGGAGFIGRHTVAELERRDIEAISLDRSTGTDLLTSDLVSILRGCDAVIHLAGVLGTAELFDSVQTAIEVNMGGTARVLDAALRNDCRYVGITMPPVFPSIYTATKVGAGRIAEAYHHSFELPVCHVKAFNAYGPDQAYGVGHPQKILPTFSALSWRGKCMPIWGDGQQGVDMVHVDHIAEMLAQCAAPVSRGRSVIGNSQTVRESKPQPFPDQNYYCDGSTYDAGTGQHMTVLDVAMEIGKVTGSTKVQFLPMRKGEIPQEKLVALTENTRHMGLGVFMDRWEESVTAYSSEALRTIGAL